MHQLIWRDHSAQEIEKERERERERDRERGALYKPERDRYIERGALYKPERDRYREIDTEREELYINQIQRERGALR